MSGDFLGKLESEYGTFRTEHTKQLILITRRDWEHLKTNFPLLAPEGAIPEDAGFMLYLFPEQSELLQNLKKRWES